MRKETAPVLPRSPESKDCSASPKCNWLWADECTRYRSTNKSSNRVRTLHIEGKPHCPTYPHSARRRCGWCSRYACVSDGLIGSCFPDPRRGGGVWQQSLAALRRGRPSMHVTATESTRRSNRDARNRFPPIKQHFIACVAALRALLSKSARQRYHEAASEDLPPLQAHASHPYCRVRIAQTLLRHQETPCGTISRTQLRLPTNREFASNLARVFQSGPRQQHLAHVPASTSSAPPASRGMETQR